MLAVFIVAAFILVYASLALDSERKCQNGQQVASSQLNILTFLHTVMIIGGSLGVLYGGYHLFVPESMQDKVEKYF